MHLNKNIYLYLYFCALLITICGAEADDNDDQINEVICSSNKLVVKGNKINISDILNITCLKQAKFIELFALDTLIIDANFDMIGQKVQLSIIAPKWEVIGEERKIILDGRDVQPLFIDYASSGIGKFKDGNPGKPGDSAGCFLGIGNEFINGENLQIHVNGGAGGPGQFGGNGRNEFLIIFDSLLRQTCFKCTKF